ncbi:MAG: cytochrome c3 family protein [Acidobacteria bacterium]|nr:cytochrome c3 family protein [Acidobacteriota bacterium]
MQRCALVACLLLAADARAQTTADAAAAAFKDDVHAAAGLACSACHRSAAAGMYDAPARTATAPLCATCHGDAAYMRKFDPQLRVDQFAQYRTSGHGKRMEAGDGRVATCNDCHGAHGVRRVRDARSPVAPLNVVATCGRCHGDAARMALFGRQATAPEEWSASVHAAALVKRGDTSAPTCVSCHGSHGATPPGVASVANVCAQCHLREAELFRASPKRDIFEALGQAECLVCHGNHRIESPPDSWVGVQEGAVCTQCHDATGDSGAAIVDIRRRLDGLQAALSAADAILTRAEHAGMLVDEGRLALQTAREHQVQSRALVHAFAAAPFAKTADEGLAAARRAHEAGEAAMRELQVRRQGLGVATLLVLAFLVTLWAKIRRLPPA